MRSFARWGLVLLIGAVAFVFFGSVICPPVDEREAEGAEEVQYPLQEEPGTYKPLPGEVQIEDRFPAVPETPEEAAPGAVEEDAQLSFQLLDDTGRPVSGAELVLMLQPEQGNPLRQEHVSPEDGKIVSAAIPPSIAAFHAILRHPQFFDAEVGPMAMPAQPAGTFLVAMVPAARIQGLLQGVDRKPLVHGWLSLTPIDGGETIRFTPKAGGVFESPKLLSGSYRLTWTATPEAETITSMTYAMTLEPRQSRRFVVTLDEGAQGTADGATPGILEVPE